MNAIHASRRAAVATPSRSTSATAAGLEKPGAPVATVAAAGRETRAPQTSVAADVRRLKSSCSRPSNPCRVNLSRRNSVKTETERRPVNSQPAANQRGGLGNLSTVALGRVAQIIFCLLIERLAVGFV